MAKFIGENSLAELVSKTKTLVATKQNILSIAGSSTKPIYISASGTISECSTYAGGTAVTLNGTSKASSTASFYAPTSAISTSTSKRYLVGSSSTTSVATENTNESCYMSGGKLYSNGNEVQEKLVSGTNIKTINSTSLLGSGNISTEVTTNKVTSLSSSSTDTQYPSAKCVYDLVGDVETLLTALNSGQGV